MAVVFVEGFDMYNGVGNTTASAVGVSARWNAGNTALTTGRFGGQAFIVPSGSNSSRGAVVTLPATYTSGAIGFAVYLPSLSGGGSGQNAALAVLGLNSLTPGIDFYSRGQLFISSYIAGGVQVGTFTTPDMINATGVLTAGTWAYIELEFVISDTVGTLNLYINGTLAGSASGQDTKYLAGAGFNQIGLGPGNYMGLSSGAYFDDLYVTDTPTRLGEQRVVTTYVDADSSNISWSPNTGTTLYTRINETLCDGDTSYVYAGTLNADAVFGVQDLPVVPIGVNAVQIGSFTRKTDTGLRTVALQYQTPTGVQYNSSDYTLGSSYGRQINLLPTNPATGSPWTASEINAMKIGVKVTT